MSTRITGGEFRSRTIKTPSGQETRPTGSRVREALFNILGDVTGDVFFDVYAGSGSVGFEAVSRGADKVILIENGRPAIQCIKENIGQLKVKNITLISTDAEKYCAGLKDESIDVFFCDPPFVKEYPDYSWVTRLLKKDGVAIFQYPTRDTIPWLASADKIKKYGESTLAFMYK